MGPGSEGRATTQTQDMTDTEDSAGATAILLQEAGEKGDAGVENPGVKPAMQEISLEQGDSAVEENGARDRPVAKKEPKRILHFSDGTLEEYSDSDEEEEPDKSSIHREKQVVDPHTLAWMPWFRYHVGSLGEKTLKACDYVGEPLANFLGITTSRYEWELEEYKRRKAEEDEEKGRQEAEMKGWVEPGREVDGSRQVVEQPLATHSEVSEHI